jgi:hypothetical protein
MQQAYKTGRISSERTKIKTTLISPSLNTLETGYKQRRRGASWGFRKQVKYHCISLLLIYSQHNTTRFTMEFIATYFDSNESKYVAINPIVDCKLILN